MDDLYEGLMLAGLAVAFVGLIAYLGRPRKAKPCVVPREAPAFPARPEIKALPKLDAGGVVAVNSQGGHFYVRTTDPVAAPVVPRPAPVAEKLVAVASKPAVVAPKAPAVKKPAAKPVKRAPRRGR